MSRPGDSPRIAVVGAGIVGLCTSYALLEHGAEVTVFEPGRPGNAQSGGESRIFRHAHDDPRLISFAAEGREIWSRWEQELGTELVSTDGVVAIGDRVADRLRLIEGVGGIDAGKIDAAGIGVRLPIFAGFEGEAMFDAAGGAIRVRAAVEALAGRLGERLQTEEVIALRPEGDGVEVRAGGRRRRFDAVIVCAGRETPRLARGIGLSLPVAHAAHVRATFELRAEPPERLACFQDGSGGFGESGIYAAPLPGNSHYALGLSETTEVEADGGVVDPSGLAALEQRACSYVERAFPGLDPEPVDLRHCWVTTLPWGDDGVAAWRHERVYLVAGHNLFKQAPRIGRSLAASAVGLGEVEAVLRPESRLGEPEG